MYVAKTTILSYKNLRGLRGLSLKLEDGPSDFDKIWLNVAEYGLPIFLNLYARKNLSLLGKIKNKKCPKFFLLLKIIIITNY